MNAISFNSGGGGGTYCLLLVRGASSARAAGAAGASVTAHFDDWVLGGWELVGGCCLFGVVVEVGRALSRGKGTATKRAGGVIYRPLPIIPPCCFRT